MTSADRKALDRTKANFRTPSRTTFCATGTPVQFTRSLGNKLNAAVDAIDDFTWGSPTALPDDRSPLKDIITVSSKKVGEGSVVQIVAYFMHALRSNTDQGEKVNCDETGGPNNDIHIYLSLTSGEDDRCESVNAEISPHFRPKAWEKIVGLNINAKRPLRVTGQLMLDASHRQCEGDHRASPARFTAWEIHPVYNLEVCKFKVASKCKASMNASWIPFDEWLGEDPDSDDHPPVASSVNYESAKRGSIGGQVTRPVTALSDLSSASAARAQPPETPPSARA